MKRHKTPSFIQMEATECGAAALGMILAYFGCWKTLEELRVTCGVTRDGSKLSNLIKAANGYGLDTNAYIANAREIYNGDGPVIVLWEQDHYVVVEGTQGNYVYLNDPAKGPIKITKQAFETGFSRVALYFSKTEKFKPMGKKPNSFLKLLPYLRSSKPAASYIFFMSMLIIIPGILLPATMKILIDDIFILNYVTWIFPLFLLVVAVALFDGATTYFQKYYLIRIENKIALGLSSHFFWHVLRAPMTFFSQRYLGDIISRVYSCHTVGMIVGNNLIMNLVNLFSIIIYSLIMLIFCWQLTLLVVIFNISSIFITIHQTKILKSLHLNLANQTAQTNAILMEGLNIIRTLKTLALENYFYSKWAGSHANEINTNQHMIRKTVFIDKLPVLLSSLSSAIILGIGGLLIMNGYLSIGGLMAFKTLSKLINAPLSKIVSFFTSSWQMLSAEMKRIQDASEAPLNPMLVDSQIPPSKDYLAPLYGNIELRKISFAFNTYDKNILDDINIQIKAGEKIAIIGPSNSGKSILLKLILGVLQPTQGEVFFDNTPLNKIPHANFVANVVEVNQEFSTFTGTVKDNIVLWNNLIGGDTITKAAKDACIDDIIVAREEGYSTVITPGSTNFSISELQRIELAKALVRDPTIIIMDEATTTFDSTLEKKINENLRKRHCTVIYVSHQVNTLMDCDRIYLVDAGKIVAMGSHETLIKENKLYQQLVTE